MPDLGNPQVKQNYQREGRQRHRAVRNYHNGFAVQSVHQRSSKGTENHARQQRHKGSHGQYGR